MKLRIRVMPPVMDVEVQRGSREEASAAAFTMLHFVEPTSMTAYVRRLHALGSIPIKTATAARHLR
jgi:hypothetical protein